MLIIIFLGVCLLTSVLVSVRTHWEELMFVPIILGVLFFLSIIVVPLHRGKIEREILMFTTAKQTLEAARENQDALERVGCHKIIISHNKWLANIQYWNNSFLDIYIPDEVMKLESIK